MHQPWTWSLCLLLQNPLPEERLQWLMAGGMHAQGKVTGAGLTQQPLPRDFLCQSESPHMAVTHGSVQEQPCFTGSGTLTLFQ